MLTTTSSKCPKLEIFCCTANFNPFFHPQTTLVGLTMPVRFFKASVFPEARIYSLPVVVRYTNRERF